MQLLTLTSVVAMLVLFSLCTAYPHSYELSPGWNAPMPLLRRADNETKPTTTPDKPSPTKDSTTTAASKAPDIRVSGSMLVDEKGNKFACHGLAIQGTEYQCAHGFGFGEGNGLDQEEIDGILTWGPNCVRVGLNQGCWLGETIPGFNNTQYIGDTYRKRMAQWVNLLLSNGLVVIVDLHWSSGGYVSLGQQIMPDPKSVTFWKSVATTLNKPGVVYDLFNEAYPRSWICWRDGGDACADEDKNKLNYTAVGMQTLVDTVRATGSKQPMMIECTEGDGGADFSKYLRYLPKDPLKNIIAGIHLYSTLGNCNQPSCFEEQMAPVAKQMPVMVGELGQFMCNKTWFETAATFFDTLNIGYIVWSWFKPYGSLPAENPQDCSNLPFLIKDWDGSPNNWGVDVKRHFAKYKGAAAGKGGTPSGSGGGNTSLMVDSHKKRCADNSVQERRSVLRGTVDSSGMLDFRGDVV